MGDAALAAISGFQIVLLNQKNDLDTADIKAQSLESLLTLAGASYGKADAVWGFPAVKALMLAARHDIELHGYHSGATLKTVLDYVRSLASLEVVMEKAGKRRLQVFPPYVLSFEASVPALLDLVAHQVKVDVERPGSNPFQDFLAAAEDVRHHYRELSKMDFEGTLLRKWVVDSLMAAARVHWWLLTQPPAGAEGDIEDVDKSLRWLISWVPSYFPESPQVHRFQANEAADSLACLGIRLLEYDRIETAQRCASAIADLANNNATLRPDPYALADLHERLEVLARAADTLEKVQAAVDMRAMIQRPATVTDADWPHFLEARQTGLKQLERSLRERRNSYGLRDNPIFELQRVMSARQREANLGQRT
jgi:hypothetical protein